MIIIAIATTFDRIENINLSQFPIHADFKYVISCQGEMLKSSSDYVHIIERNFGINAQFMFMQGFGLSKNRNASLSLAKRLGKSGDYIYVSDDDVHINVAQLLQARRVAISDKLDFVSGMVTTSNGLFKNYPKKDKVLSKNDCAKISSVELLVALDFLNKKNVGFDERFGLGGIYPSGEEYIFCSDMITVGAKGKFLPIVFCEHPPFSSGQDFFSELIKIKAKGAMFSRVHGKYIGVLYSFAFSVKKWPIYKHRLSFFDFVKNIMKGSSEI